jgi:hypothetical protein
VRDDGGAGFVEVARHPLDGECTAPWIETEYRG